MKTELNEIEVNGVSYVKKESIQNYEKAEKLDGMKYVIIRTYSAGVHAGYLESEDGKIVVLRNARRIWYWDGAASLSQLAMEGTNKPDNCQFPCEVDRIKLTEAVEIIDCTEKARLSIKAVKVWRK